MTKGKGYLLPSGDASEDDLECAIVFYPARDEYRRALMGSLDFLATWLAWERDSGKRGQDAAASWKLANIQTWECSAMGYCDDLATTLQALLAATQALECCGDQDITDGLQYTDDIVDGVGNVPQNIIDAGYASGPTDWAGFDDYKCMISHLAVDHIETFFRGISPFVSESGTVIGGIGVVGALLGAILVVVGLPIAAGIILALGAAAGIWTWIATYGKDAVDDLADDIATNHDALACAIYNGDGVSDAIDDFNLEVDDLFSAIDAIAIKAVGFEPQLRAMYAGRYDQQDIAEKMDDLGYELTDYTCNCEIIYDVDMEYDFAAGTQGWTGNARAPFKAIGGWCNVEQSGWGMNANVLSAAVAEENLAQMFTFHSETAPVGSERFFVQFVEFYWRPCATCVQDPDFLIGGVTYHPDDFDKTVAGLYSYEWSSGNEPELQGAHEVGLRSPNQSESTDWAYAGLMYSFRIAGFVAEGS